MPEEKNRQVYNAPNGDLGICDYILMAISILFMILIPISIFQSIKVVQEYERAVIFRLGRLLGGAKGPGIFFIIPCTDEYRKIDMRTRLFDVPPQEILTKDSVTVAMDAVVYYRIKDATMAVANVENADASTRLLAQTTLRNVLGTKSLSEILTDREHIASTLLDILDGATDVWGISVERVEIKDVRLPVQLQRAMAAEAEAAREARAKVIAAEGEMNASVKLREAANIMSSAPNAMQLRYLQTLNTISAEKNSTIVFPLPVEMFSSFTRSNNTPQADIPSVSTGQPQATGTQYSSQVLQRLSGSVSRESRSRSNSGQSSDSVAPGSTAHEE